MLTLALGSLLAAVLSAGPTAPAPPEREAVCLVHEVCSHEPRFCLVHDECRDSLRDAPICLVDGDCVRGRASSR